MSNDKDLNQSFTVNKPLVEGEDYYIEDGNWVFTEKFHLDRGHCCDSGCRHCPYKNLKDTDASC